jgi:hypothetical protein
LAMLMQSLDSVNVLMLAIRRKTLKKVHDHALYNRGGKERKIDLPSCSNQCPLD